MQKNISTNFHAGGIVPYEVLPYQKNFPPTIRGRTVGHSGTVWYCPSLVLSMAFRRDRLPYTLEILQWRRGDNDRCSASVTL